MSTEPTVSANRLRFRAWSANQERMFEDATNLACWQDICCKNSPEHEKVNKHYTIMQSTGLLDKNGKEIFEGDIVAVPYVTPFGDLTDDEDIDARSEIGFEHGQFVLLGKPQSQSIVAWCRKEKGEYIPNFGNRTIIHDQTKLEIIGNIYENPDLLPQ